MFPYLAQTGAPSAPPPSVFPAFSDPASSAALIIAVCWGIWGQLKRQSTHAHAIIVDDRAGAKEREKTDSEQIKLLLAQNLRLAEAQAAMQRSMDLYQAAQSDANKIQVQQAGELGELRNAVGELRTALAEARADNARLREQLMRAEAGILIEKNRGDVAERERDELKVKLEISDARVKRLSEAFSESGGRDSQVENDIAREALAEFGAPEVAKSPESGLMYDDDNEAQYAASLGDWPLWLIFVCVVVLALYTLIHGRT